MVFAMRNQSPKWSSCLVGIAYPRQRQTIRKDGTQSHGSVLFPQSGMPGYRTEWSTRFGVTLERQTRQDGAAKTDLFHDVCRGTGAGSFPEGPGRTIFSGPERYVPC